eukprot:140851-Hanusia_phi.AAC.1
MHCAAAAAATAALSGHGRITVGPCRPARSDDHTVRRAVHGGNSVTRRAPPVPGGPRSTRRTAGTVLCRAG